VVAAAIGGRALAQGVSARPAPRELPPAADVKTPWVAPPATQEPPFERALPPSSTQHRPGTPRLATDASRSIPRVDHDRVYYDALADGTVWARGATYKARFDADGATYIPALGARAPRNHPLTFRLASVACGGASLALDAAAVATRSNDTIAYERGGVIELYELSTTAMEQEFVIDDARILEHRLEHRLEQPSAGGDLVLQIAVTSDLDARDASDGLEFSSESGSVRYGRAQAFDAAGATLAASTALTDHGIEIRVPSSELASARLPIRIDPIVSTFVLDSSTFDDFLPDVAYDVTNNRYYAVYEETFSAADHDVYSVLMNATAGGIFSQYIDMTSDYWAAPKVANNNIADQFLVVAQVGLPTSGARIIRGRTALASNLSLGPQFTISGTDFGDLLNPDVGGDPFTGPPSYYAVVWERVISASDHDIHAQLVLSNSTLLSPSMILIDNTSGTIDTNPSISKSDNSVEWTIVWQRAFTPTNHDIYGAQLRWDGTITTPSFAIDTSSFDDTHPAVSSPLDGSLDCLVVYQRDFLTDHDIMGRVMSGTTTIYFDDLSSLEDQGSGSLLQDQIDPCVDSDGAHFALGYSEQFSTSTTDYDAYTATFTPVASVLFASEPHVELSFTSTHEDHLRVASTHGAGGPPASRRCMILWDRATGAPDFGDIEGALYDCGQFARFCSPGFDGVIACPCGNPPVGYDRGCNNSSNTGGAYLLPSGVASIAADTMHLSSASEKLNATSIFLQGSALTNVVFGQGVRCTGGTLKRLYVKTASGGSASAPSGTDPTMSARSAALGDVLAAGSTRYYNVYYRDPTVLGGCPSASTFNSTDAVAATWAP
jgi:hypothetical protein